jgi:hypothetical protein
MSLDSDVYEIEQILLTQRRILRDLGIEVDAPISTAERVDAFNRATLERLSRTWNQCKTKDLIQFAQEIAAELQKRGNILLPNQFKLYL